MKIATTTSDFSGYCKSDIERIRELHRAGFRYIDLSMYSFTPDSVYMKDNWRDAVNALKQEADALGMTFVQAHSQGGNALRDDAEHVSFLLDATVRSIEICHTLGIKNTVVHPGYAKGISKEEWFERNRHFYQKLFPVMEALGVNVLTENSTAANMKDKYFANSGKDMLEFLRFVGLYSKGEYRKVPQVAHGYTPKVVRIRSEQEDIVTCLDGECMVSSDITIRLADKRLNFFGPAGCSCNRTAR